MDKTWRVVKIISDYEIVINGGSEDNLKKGDKLEIFVEGEEMIDPISKESLGTLDGIKAYISIVDLFEKMSICKNIVTKISNIAVSLANFETQRSERLKVDPTQISGPIDEYDKIIRIGDLVRKSR